MITSSLGYRMRWIRDTLPSEFQTCLSTYVPKQWDYLRMNMLRFTG